MSRRGQIEMSTPEVAAFLQLQRTVTCATIGPRGWPHLMPLWYVVREASGGRDAGGRGTGERDTGERDAGGRDAGESASPAGGDIEIWAWTYGSSQKAVNLSRDPRATLQVEAGESYDQLRGVMLECETVVHHDPTVVQALGVEIFKRYAVPRGQSPVDALDEAVMAMLAKQAPKRVGLQFRELRRATWDHRKLAGVY